MRSSVCAFRISLHQRSLVAVLRRNFRENEPRRKYLINNNNPALHAAPDSRVNEADCRFQLERLRDSHGSLLNGAKCELPAKVMRPAANSWAGRLLNWSIHSSSRNEFVSSRASEVHYTLWSMLSTLQYGLTRVAICIILNYLADIQDNIG